MKHRYESGREIKQVSLCELAYDLKTLEGSYNLSYVQVILSKKDVSFWAVRKLFGKGKIEADTGMNARDVALGAEPENRRFKQFSQENKHVENAGIQKAKGMNALEGKDANQGAALFFQQCLARFYERPYFEAPPNLNEPLDEAAQPSASTWLDRVLHRLEDKVANIDEFVNASKDEARYVCRVVRAYGCVRALHASQDGKCTHASKEESRREGSSSRRSSHSAASHPPTCMHSMNSTEWSLR